MGRLEPVGISSVGHALALLWLVRGRGKGQVQASLAPDKLKHVLPKKAPRREGVEHKVLLQSVSEDDRPVTIVPSARHQINGKPSRPPGIFAGIRR